MLDHMGPLRGGPPIIHGVRLGRDIRYYTAEEIAFQLWHEEMHELGYQLLTEKAAADLHDRGTSIFLRSWLEYYSSDYKRSRKIRHAVRLVSPHQQIVDGYEHTGYCLDTAHSKKEYTFSILAASDHDATAQGLWFYKASSWHKASGRL